MFFFQMDYKAKNAIKPVGVEDKNMPEVFFTTWQPQSCTYQLLITDL